MYNLSTYSNHTITCVPFYWFPFLTLSLAIYYHLRKYKRSTEKMDPRRPTAYLDKLLTFRLLNDALKQLNIV